MQHYDFSPSAADRRSAELGNDISVIPAGAYCYRPVSTDENGCLKISLCPYWGRDDSRPAQESGYCAYLGSGDWESEGISLLWDQVKECGLNDDDEVPHCLFLEKEI